MPIRRIHIAGEDWLLVGPGDVRRLESAEQARRVLDADPVAATDLLRNLLPHIGDHDTGNAEQDQLARLADALARSEALLVRVDDFRPLDAPEEIPLIPPEEPAPVEPLRPPAPKDGPVDPFSPFIDIVVVGEDLEPPVTGDLELRIDGRIRLPWKPINNEEGVQQRVPDTGKLLATLRTLSWWKDTSVPAEPTPPVELVEFEDILFSFNSLVLLPTAGVDPDLRRPEHRMYGLGAICTVFRRLAARPATLLLAGHTDTLGSTAYNLTLSEERAENVLAVLKGDKQAWAAACAVKHYKVDWKIILRWVHDTFDWDCDPGPINELATERSTHALQSFRVRYASHAKLEPLTGEICQADWAAFFDMYELELAKALGHTDVAGLAERRSALQLTTPPILGCGERWPREKAGRDDYGSAANRRVDLWLFREDLPSPDRYPPGVELYGEEARFGPRYIPIVPEKPDQGFEIAVVDDHHDPLPGATVRILRNGQAVASLRTGAGGHVWVKPPGQCEVEIEGCEVGLGYGGPSSIHDDDSDEPRDPDAPWTEPRVSLYGDQPALVIAHPSEPPFLPIIDPPAGPTPPPADPTSPYGPNNPYRFAELTKEGLTEAEFALKQRTYLAHIAHAVKERRFIEFIPAGELDYVDGKTFRLRKHVVPKATALLSDARASLQRDKNIGDPDALATLKIGISSAYRDAAWQFTKWNELFPQYLREKYGPSVDCSRVEVGKLVEYFSRYFACPGYSRHNDGRAIDFKSTHEKKIPWKQRWLYRWLHNHAADHGFVPLSTEPWHWSHPG